ncbi:hypothetical protein [Nitrosophilus kaiyonis]|uniref:hypothetical protein n=1 Tax=Nitrosophilus kaiyonis TaxID=2930200 RepID=UPI00248FB7D2|nr:hypothetical protein [Nitrosophilus kaiyonis]
MSDTDQFIILIIILLFIIIKPLRILVLGLIGIALFLTAISSVFALISSLFYFQILQAMGFLFLAVILFPISLLILGYCFEALSNEKDNDDTDNYKTKDSSDIIKIY